MTHIMLDLETLGKLPGCAIRSIGATVFDPATGKMGETFYANVSRESCEAVGLTIDPGTEAWWAEQSDAARAALDVDPRPLAEVLVDFELFWQDNDADRVWAHGAPFDPPILEDAYRALGMKAPWKYTGIRDTRTAYDMGGVAPDRSAGVHHHALVDAQVQARAVAAAYAALRRPGLVRQLLTHALVAYLAVGIVLGGLIWRSVPAMNVAGWGFYAATWPMFVCHGTGACEGLPYIPTWAFTFPKGGR